MHGNYWFLITVDDQPTDEDLWAEGDQAFHKYLRTHGDENNYGRMHTIITRDNRMLTRTKDDITRDNRMLTRTKDDKLESKPSSCAYDHAACWAMNCVVADCLFYDPVHAVDDYLFDLDDCSIEQMTKDTQLWLVDELRRTGSHYRHSRHDDWQIKTVITSRTALRSARYSPFSVKLYTPYEYRAFDLRRRKYKQLQTGDIFLVADIHT